MTALSRDAYFHVLDDIVNKYNNTVHRTIKMKPIDVTSGSYAEYNVDSNEKDPKLKVGHRVRISKYKNIFSQRIYSKLIWRRFCNKSNQKYSSIDLCY